MIKLKEIIGSTIFDPTEKDKLREHKYSFDRKFGEPLPTFKSVMKKHQANESDEKVSEVTKSTCPECGHEY